MPTRIILKENPSSAQTTSSPPRRRPAHLPAGLVPRGDSEDDKDSPTQSNEALRHSTPRSARGFHSSILKELAVRDATTDEDEEELEFRLSKDDIRASPRLLGYLFSIISGGVMLVSVVQFYREENFEISVLNVPDRYFEISTGSVVIRWKLWAAIYVAVAGVALCLLTVLVHFDTLIAPKLWCVVFRDGSLAERNWILFLTAVWGVGVHVATSSLSVGEVQANVFFTTWIAFASMALNYSVWRETAGLASVTASLDRNHRETTYNWLWTGLFSAIFAGSATDIYYNRDNIELRLEGEQLFLDRRAWLIILCVVWAEVALCGLAIALNEFVSPNSCFPQSNNRWGKLMGWKHLEGVIILVAMAGKFWVIIRYSGVNGVINGLSNAYFGIWGSFFNSVFAFGTWLRESKTMEYIVRERRPSYKGSGQGRIRA